MGWVTGFGGYQHWEDDEMTWNKTKDDTMQNNTPLPDEETAAFFPYTLAQLTGWAIKRKDGSIVKTVLTTREEDQSRWGQATKTPLGPATKPVGSGWASMSDFCHHTPTLKQEPTFQSGKLRLFMADCAGVRASKDRFNLVIDCGDVLRAADITHGADVISGDETLTDALYQYQTDWQEEYPRLLKLRWEDRKAPNLMPEFWVALAAELGREAEALAKVDPGDTFDVVINCIGGHGRSGTAMVCLMMVMNPEYGAGAAITHLRAIHCARAIESKDQHEYINKVAKSLGQAEDAEDAMKITDYKKAFLALDLKSASGYQKRLLTKPAEVKK